MLVENAGRRSSKVSLMSVSSFLAHFGRSKPSRKGRTAPAQTKLACAANREARPAGSAQSDWELTLSATAKTWLTQFPPAVKPRRLSEAFPRIANRLALCWHDAVLIDKVMDDLLVDKRGGRTGFPSTISAELLRLQSFHERRQRNAKAKESPIPSKAWEQHLQASADR